MSNRGTLDPAAIERELQNMWRAAGADSLEGPVVRAALVNFILLDRERATVADIVSHVSEIIPCRALVMETGDASGPPLEAWTSMHCRPAGRGQQVCCEQVTIRVRPDALEGLPAALLGLLLPDLPTVLAALGDVDFEGPVLGRLARHVDRMIVDSAQFSRSDTQLAQLQSWNRHDVLIADLNWSRLDAWRELFAAFFDAPPFDGALHELDQVDIEYAPASRAGALLFAGWLISRLDWRRTGGTVGRPVFESTGGRVTVGLQAQPAGGPVGLRRVAARAADGTRFVVEIDAHHPTVLVGRMESTTPCPVPRRIEARISPADAALVQVLQRAPNNPAHAAALDAAVRLVVPRSA